MPADTLTDLEVLCPAGTSILSGDGSGVSGYTAGVPDDDTLVVRAVCAAVSPAAPLRRHAGSGRSAR